MMLVRKQLVENCMWLLSPRFVHLTSLRLAESPAEIRFVRILKVGCFCLTYMYDIITDAFLVERITSISVLRHISVEFVRLRPTLVA